MAEGKEQKVKNVAKSKKWQRSMMIKVVYNYDIQAMVLNVWKAIRTSTQKYKKSINSRIRALDTI